MLIPLRILLPYLTIALLLLVEVSIAQIQGNLPDADPGRPYPSPHALQSAEHPLPVLRERTNTFPRSAERELTHTVFGYHPYWIADSVTLHYHFELLSHLAYFSAEVDPVSGELSTTRNWMTAAVVDRALAAGVKVQLAVTNFGAANNRTLLQSPAARDTLITRLIELVQQRNANGLAIDFEAVPADQRNNLTAFFGALRGRLLSVLPEAEISAAVPAVDWNNSWDAEALAQYIDIVFVMCYDYSWSGSSVAGPVAPVRGMTFNVDRSLDTWLQSGIPKEQLIMGIPYYGYDWPVDSDAPRSATTGKASARTYSYVKGMLQRYQRQWSDAFLNPWFPYNVVDWRQVWYDDAESLGHKYQFVFDKELGGMGIWALGYDGDWPELWDAIETRFTRTTAIEAALDAVPGRLHVYPQPAEAGTNITVVLGEATPHEMTVAISDLLGREHWAAQVTGYLGSLVIQLPELRTGVYLLRVADGRALHAQTLLIRK